MQPSRLVFIRYWKTDLGFQWLIANGRPSFFQGASTRLNLKGIFCQAIARLSPESPTNPTYLCFTENKKGEA
jgi:hypothetical protein